MDINAFWHDVLSKKREALRRYFLMTQSSDGTVQMNPSR